MPYLYAVRDRLIDYFMQPFIGPSDAQVKASMSTLINDEENKSAITQAPQHFELWRLAEIDEHTGQVGGEREFLCDATSLIRNGVRKNAEGGPGARTLDESEGSRAKSAAGAADAAHPGQRAPESALQAEAQPGEKADRRS